MPDTQAFAVEWRVTIQPEGDVSDDVAEITLIEEHGVDSATVKLDTSKRPHALEEQHDISIRLDDGNTVREFDGYTDKISDDEERPVVTVDARTPIGVLDDATAVGVIEEDNLFRVIEAILDRSAGRVRELYFDPADLESQYGTFAGSTDYGDIDIGYSGQFDASREAFEQHETTSEGKEAELRIDSYTNNTNSSYLLDIVGTDTAGNEVTASVDLPPGDDAEAAFGARSFKLALTGGNELWDAVTSISTDIPTFQSGSDSLVTMDANVYNYVQTDWRFQLDSLTSVRSAVSRIVQYISGLDDARDWEFYVDDETSELVVQPERDATPSTYVFREGDNVLKPVASRDLDGVRNFIKVTGSGGVNFWAWAYDGRFQYSLDNPFETGAYPSNGVSYGSSPAGGRNDIDEINIRAETLSSNQFTSVFQAIDIGKKALREFYRTPVSGQAPTAGLHPAVPGDRAEVFYPSRGIPQKVAENTFPVEKVETRVTPESATTVLDFGSSKPNLADQIESGSSMIRDDISSNVAQYATSVSSGGPGDGGEAADAFPVLGTAVDSNDTGTWQVETEAGERYDDVQVFL
jgi:hypothetical protein